MKTIRFILLLCIAVISGTLSAQSQRELGELMRNRGEYYFTLSVEDVMKIPNLGDLCSVDGIDGHVVVAYANQKEYDKLISLGLHPDLKTPPSLRQEAKMWEGGDRATYAWNSYLTYEQYVSMMEGFPDAALNDRTCEMFSLGTLSTSNHRQLLGVHIYKDSPNGKPRFLYSSTMHGDEVTGMILMLRLIDELCTSTDTRILNLLNDVDIYILPLTNPDGTYAAGNNTVEDATRANGNNVDLNRNYKDYFNGEHPDSKSYQDETNWTMTFANEKLFTMGANYHGGSEVMNYCWDWVFENHADTDWWEYVCTEYVTLARQINSTYMGGYNYGTNNYDYDGVTRGATWYSITGSRQDYMNAFGQCREVTVECSKTKTVAGSDLPAYWTYHHNCMLALMEQARNGVHGVVNDASTGQTIQGVKVSVLNHDIHNSYVTTHEVGDFHRPIKGGTYTFVFDKEGYARKFVEVSVADGGRQDITVNLVPSNETQKEYFISVDKTSINAGTYIMGYLNGSTLVMPTHSNTNTSTSVSMSTTSNSVTITDDGFTLNRGSEPIKVSLNASGVSGQYLICYKGRLLSRSNSTLSWAKPSNSSGNGVDLTSYRWYVNDDGIYQVSNGTKYYLNYNNGFTAGTSKQNNVFFYEEIVQSDYHIYADVLPLGSGIMSGTGGYNEGDPCTLMATAASGYTFSHWTLNGIVVSTSANYTFTVEGDATYVANFVPTSGGHISGTVWAETPTITPNQNYLIGFENGGNVYLAVNYAVNESNHYYLDNNSTYYGYTAPAVLEGNHVTGVDGTYANDLQYCTWKFGSSTGGTIQSGYQSNYYLRTYTQTSYGDLYPSTTTNQTWTYESNQLYRTVNNTKRYAGYYALNGNPHMLVDNNASSTVKLYTQVAIDKYAITATANIIEGGSIAGSNYYTNGSTCTLTATAMEGYVFVNWTENDVEVSTDAAYSFEVNAPRTLVANFAIEYELPITAYTTGQKDHYYLIASPIGAVDPDDVDGMKDNEYDLYCFDQNGGNGLVEWINYEGSNGGFDLVPGKGYLYANSADVTLTFTGLPYRGSGEVTLSKTNNVRFSGWNLVGNPFAQTAFITKPFYTMNSTGTEIIAGSGNSVGAMEGIFVIAENDGETMTFSTGSLAKSEGQIVLSVNQGEATLDRAIVRVGEGDVLPKFMLNENNTKVYITQDDQELSVARVAEAGVIPVSFKAAHNGTYSLCINVDDTEVNYLHLIDNLTGADIDILQTPTYSFNATKDDYTSRFKLVFATICEDADGDNDTFAFFTNDNWIISNDGEAVLQVIDINGRVLSSEEIHGSQSKHISAVPGIYMLRLIKGDDVKVQKIVVR